jgi:hypothetical protein
MFLSLMVGWVSLIGVESQGGVMPWVEHETRPAASCLPAHGSDPYQLEHLRRSCSRPRSLVRADAPTTDQVRSSTDRYTKSDSSIVHPRQAGTSFRLHPQTWCGTGLKPVDFGVSERTLKGTAFAAQGFIHHTRTHNPNSAKPRRRAISSCGTWLYVEGVGRPRPDLPPAQRRLMARRAAEVDAMRNLALAHRTRRTPPFRVVLTEHAPDGSVRVVLQSRVP